MPAFINIVLKVLAREIKQEKDINQIQIEKEVSLFAGGVILYIVNPKEYTRRLLELIDELGKLQDTRSAIQILLYFYILAMSNPKMKLRKQFYVQKHEKDQNT